jgi:hypothetical protein
MEVSAQDAFIFGVCVGFAMTMPIALILHVLWRLINHEDLEP